MAKIAILPVRFQNSYLHAGHKNLIDFAQDENDMVLIVLGTNPTRLTVDNPLSFDMRKEMIQTEYPKVAVVGLPDYKYDSVWSEKLDEMIGKWILQVDILNLEEHGYRIAVYEAAEYRNYKNHLVIKQETSILKECFSLKDELKLIEYQINIPYDRKTPKSTISC